jgi:hypothetical protein
MSIGTDVFKHSKKMLPSKAELTIKAPPPFDILQLRLEWGRKERKQLSDEEFRHLLARHLKKRQHGNVNKRSKPKPQI